MGVPKNMSLVSLVTVPLLVMILLLLLLSQICDAQNSPQDYVYAHNIARYQVGVRPLIWDETIAYYAENYVNQLRDSCNMVHSRGPYGENLAWHTGDLTGMGAVNMWVREKPYYDYYSNSCVDGVDCLHYTQVVWSRSVRLGCAKVRCSDGYRTIVSCNYYPPVYEWGSRTQGLQESQKLISGPLVLAGVLCFIASSISSAGGIGGGGLFIPILTIVAGLDLKTASSLSAFMVTGGSCANVMCNLVASPNKFGGKPLIDYDIAFSSEPCMLLGVSLGVICNLVFPEWLITALFAVFLAWSTSKTCKSGLMFWKTESEEIRKNGLENRLLENKTTKGSKGLAQVNNENEENRSKLGIPWLKLGVLLLVWFSFFSIYLLRGNRYGQSIIPMEPCGVGYWILSSVQVPLAVVFTAWIAFRKESLQEQSPILEHPGLTRNRPSNKLVFPLMALLAGMLGGVFGIGGGMLISPLLLQVGIAPQVAAATCSFMVFFSSTMSALQYLLLGMENIQTAFILAMMCFVASLLGLLVIQRAIQKYGRASLIVFSVGIVMSLSTVLMTSYGAIEVWRDYKSGKYMGFKPPC